ncbi:metallophosphoesterase [Clostridium paridis]|uniref:Metallophosphoesterase n=1 Tax=Clostridium paridis TaxID=2803863 RepID=A0A937K3Y4_9CLOT|nr:metallophosphoesterase [Clostridium paridis]MBL4931289.1 metallophosphoesterase [Clostridium paridis]
MDNNKLGNVSSEYKSTGILGGISLMKIAAIIFALALYVIINYYIGLRGIQLVQLLNKSINTKVLWIIFWFSAFSYIFSMALPKILPKTIIGGLDYIGSYYMAIMMYLLIILPIVDILRILNGKLGIFQITDFFKATVGIIITIFIMFILVYGTWNASHTVIKDYEVNINKNVGAIKDLKIIMASDIHIGSVGYKDRMEKLVEMTNKENPDMVLLAGDIINDDIQPYIDENISEYMKAVKSKYGVFAVTGNHEYISGKADKLVGFLEESGVKVLQDEYFKVDDSFYVVGRNDISGMSYSGMKRKDLSEIMEDVDRSKPIFLMDHQPKNLQESVEAGVDLEVSGHTHRGQLAPGELITGKLFEVDWGMLKKGNFTEIVSSGFGTWGPPIRIGSRSELVRIKVKLNE